MNPSSISIPANIGPIFRRSTFRNEDVLISESLKHLPLIRIIMIILCIVIGIGTLINLILIYIKYKLILKPTILYRMIVPIVLLLNILFHVSHYAHNIYDPAAYFEPKKLYLKTIMSEMELTFFFNFPLSIAFVIATRKLLLACTNGQPKSLNTLIIVIIYSSMSIVSFEHYTYEPLWTFSYICNITIAGETSVAVLLLIISLVIYQSNLNIIYSRLTTNDKSDSNIQMSIGQQRQLKSKISDDELL